MRCKCCNTLFTGDDYSPQPYPGIDEDLCSTCKWIARNSNLLNIKEYQHEHITEIPVYLENYKHTIDN